MALRACQCFFNTLRGLRLVPSKKTQALYQAVQHGGDLSQFIHENGSEEYTPTGPTGAPASPEVEQAYIGRSNQSPLVGRDRERETLRQMTGPAVCFKPIGELVGEINRHLRGWRQYFKLGYPGEAFHKINGFTRERNAGCGKSARPV